MPSTPPTRAPHRLLLLAASMFGATGTVAAHEATPEDAVAALWRALSNDAGGSADSGALQRLFHPDAVVFGAGYKEGVPGMRRTFAAAFIASNEGARATGFHECEVARTLHVYDRFAVAYSVVESRTEKDAPAADFVGVNSVQLYRENAQWTIVSLYYHVEKPDLPVPLDGGTSGVCL